MPHRQCAPPRRIGERCPRPSITEDTIGSRRRASRSERRIPDAVVEVAQINPEARLLLLCNEPLVRSTTALQNGRVTLVGPPLTAGKIFRCIHFLLNDGAREGRGRDTMPIPGLVGGPVDVSEHQREAWWLATVGCDPSGHDGAHARLPVLDQAEGVTVILSRPGSTLDAEAIKGRCPRRGRRRRRPRWKSWSPPACVASST